MKKIFAIMAAALIAFNFSSCKKGDAVDQDNYKIEVSDITYKSATIKVTPADSTTTYYWDVLEASEAAKLSDEQVGAYLKEILDEAIAYYAQYGADVTYSDFIVKGADEYAFSRFESNTEYTVVAMAMDAKGACSGKASRKNFKTLEQTEDPVPADMTFQIKAEDINYAGAKVTVTPSTDEATYYWDIYETEKLAQMTDAEVCAEMKDYIEYMIEYYSAWGYDVDFADFLNKGADSYTFESLDPKTSYTVVATAMGTMGTTNGKLAKYNFETLELVPESEETLDFHDATLIDYRYLDGSFMIGAAPADSSIMVALNPFSDELAGSFTKKDLDAEYSYVYFAADKKSYNILDAEFTGVQTDNQCSYAGWIVASNLIKYNFVFNVTIEDEEQATAPAKKLAKKAAAPKAVKLHKQINLEKSKFVSEKAFTR